MAKEKYAIAYCPKSRQFYRLTLSADGHTVTAFTPTRSPAKTVRALTIPGLTTSHELRACPRCFGRKAQGCSCLRSFVSCEPGVGYRFHCIYCDQLQIVQNG